MASSSPAKASQQSPVYQIGGVPVSFPYKPYGPQLAFMSKVIATLDRAHRHGHCQALLESPTGTGKSLSLLCASLAWQNELKLKKCGSKFADSRPSFDPPRRTDASGSGESGGDENPFLNGGGFIPEPDPPGNLEQASTGTSNGAEKNQKIPTIIFASRTHSQISQVISEYRKTSYRVPMVVLASRKHYCTNKYICQKENVDEECKLLIKKSEVACSEFRNVKGVLADPSLQKGGSLEVHDIEDLVKLGKKQKGCSYFAARTMVGNAQIVFSPYSYILNPIIRRAMEIDLKGSIVILDEAHNIEDMAREAGSLDVEEEILDTLLKELEQLIIIEGVASIYQPLFDMVQGLITWIIERKSNLEKHEFEHHYSCWTGDKALRELQVAGVTQQCFPILQDCAAKAIRAAAEMEGVHLSGMSAATLEGLFSSLGYIFSDNGNQASDYQLVVQRFVKRDASFVASGWTHSFCLWCLSPAVVFREIADLCLSVILTSGTLSPMSSFASELGIPFEISIEAQHVIDMESQLWAAVISHGPGKMCLNASYKTSDDFAFQDSLGSSLEEICKIVPGGVLIFFPSYKMLDKLSSRWSQTGQWSRLNAIKPLFVEPRGSQDDFHSVLKGYYDSIRGFERVVPRKLKKGHNRQFQFSHEYVSNPQKGGAAFLAVCRGKVSEGINFSDENARAVIIIGIPFPNKSDIKVVLKKSYNDKYRNSKKLLPGNEWYCQQAFRALNQAAGRCIRHRFDHGAVILLDERLKREGNLNYISKWLRKSIRRYDSFENSLEGLQHFFLNVEEQVHRRHAVARNAEIVTCVIDDEDSSPLTSYAATKKKPRTKNKESDDLSNHNGSGSSFDPKTSRTSNKEGIKESNTKTGNLGKFLTDLKNDVVSFFQLNENSKVEAPEQFHEDEKAKNSSNEYHSLHSNSECFDAAYVVSHFDSPDQSTITENLAESNSTTCPIHTVKVENIDTDTVHASKQSNQMPYKSIPQTISCDVPSCNPYSFCVTPERKVDENCIPDENMEPSSVNMSVNFQSHKRKTPLSLNLDRHIQMELFRSTDSSSYPADHFQESITGAKLINLSQNEGSHFSESFNNVSDGSTTIEACLLCRVCKTELGLVEKQCLVSCSFISSTKSYVASLLPNESTQTHEQKSIAKDAQKNVQVIICDVLSIDHRLHQSCASEVDLPHGVWCEEDGCVFRTVLCPFCNGSETCLGVLILATDASNTKLLNKVHLQVLFYADCVDVKMPEMAAEVC
ncbi:Fanconi anemia group J protein isoform X2 [Amborella trichopoda]|uniref:Fanconi anemia group J protein isoform X2 n=1 Tax=Amborella trichopoda TaxID=13333 RepID=UPI0009BD6E93|nr:Fanconi anemia group J protein isoform X2 [Amborella trichopoda]|eukprot:XP_020529996.1 Fanconi anemia group J protein isoform X2 [Amborella trichopoda]